MKKLLKNKKNINLENEAIKLVSKGEEYFKNKEYSKAIKQFNKILSREDEFKSFDSYRVALYFSAHSYWRSGDKEKAIEFFLRSLDWNISKKNQIDTAKDQVNLGVLYYQSALYDKSIEYSTQAYDNFFKLKDNKGIGFCLGNLGTCYYYLGNYEKSLKYQFKAADHAKKIKDQAFLGRSLNSISTLYKELGEFKKAVETALKAIKIKEKLSESLGSIYINMGVIYKEWGNIDKALKYYKKAIKISVKEGEKDSQAIVLNNIGNLYLDQENFKKALGYFEKSQIIKEKIEDKRGLIIVLGNIGLIYSDHIKDFKKAKKYYGKALKLAKEIKNSERILSISLFLANLYSSNNQLKEAKILLDACPKYFEEVNSYKMKLEYYEYSINLFKLKKNYKKAAEFLELYAELKDEIFTEKKQKAITDMQTKYESEKKEQEAEIHRLESIKLAKLNKEIEDQKSELEKTLEELNRSNLKYNIIKEEMSKNLYSDFIGESPKIKKIIELISIVAKSNHTNVLITGESGTGKEIVARNIHKFSKRKKKSFHGINSSAIPDSLFESQFFGHEKNSFTGAEKIHIGWFEFANNGTLFLDEIGTMSTDLQVKLLRVLEERKIVRLGSHKEIPIDVRIISASNRNLLELVEKNNFREDLYYRLATFVIHIPPLRERKEDIPLLLEYFVKLFSTKLNKRVNRIEKSVESYLMKYNFPGNVRELKNIVERAVIVADSPTLKCSHFAIPEIVHTEECINTISSLHEIEKEHILKALQATNFNQSKAAELLDVERRVVARKIKKYGIKIPK